MPAAFRDSCGRFLSQFPAAGNRDQPCHRPAMPGDGQALARCNSIKQPWKMGFCFVSSDRFHARLTRFTLVDTTSLNGSVLPNFVKGLRAARYLRWSGFPGANSNCSYPNGVFRGGTGIPSRENGWTFRVSALSETAIEDA